jgi:hypothetical protein
VFTERGRRALEDAIRKVEMEVSGQSQSKEPHSASQVEKEIKLTRAWTVPRMVRNGTVEGISCNPIFMHDYAYAQRDGGRPRHVIS